MDGRLCGIGVGMFIPLPVANLLELISAAVI